MLELNWEIVSEQVSLTENLIEEFSEMVHWDNIAISQKLS